MGNIHSRSRSRRSSDSENAFPDIKITLVGNAEVGKSCIAIKILGYNSFIEDYDPTLEEAYRFSFTYNGRVYETELFDTGGSEEYRNDVMFNSYYRRSTHVLIVYDVTSNEDFEKYILSYISKIRKIKENMQIIVICNKIDKEQWITPKEDIERIVHNMNIPVIFTSAKTGENTNDIIECIKETMPNIIKNMTYC